MSEAVVCKSHPRRRPTLWPVLPAVVTALLFVPTRPGAAESDSATVIMAPYGQWAIEDIGEGDPVLLSADCVGSARSFFATTSVRTGDSRHFAGRFRITPCDGVGSAGFCFTARETTFVAMIVDDDQGARFVTRYRPMKDDRWGSLRNEALTQESPPLTGWIEIVVQAENETIICHLDGQRVAAVKDDFGLGDGEDMRWGVATASGQMECMRLRSRGPDGPVPLRLSDARLVAFRMERFFRGSGRGPL